VAETEQSAKTALAKSGNKSDENPLYQKRVKALAPRVDSSLRKLTRRISSAENEYL